MHSVLLFCQQDACASHPGGQELAVGSWRGLILPYDKKGVSADMTSQELSGQRDERRSGKATLITFPPQDITTQQQQHYCRGPRDNVDFKAHHQSSNINNFLKFLSSFSSSNTRLDLQYLLTYSKDHVLLSCLSLYRELNLI